MNKVYLMGRSGADAELKHTQSGMAVLSLSIATSKKGKQENEWVTTWHRVNVWSHKAEKIASVVKKGTKVFVEGEIVTRKWTDKNGQERTSTEIVAYNIEAITSPASQQSPSGNFGDQYPDEQQGDVPF